MTQAESRTWTCISNLPFVRWGDVFGDQVVAAAMIAHLLSMLSGHRPTPETASTAPLSTREVAERVWPLDGR